MRAFLLLRRILGFAWAALLASFAARFYRLLAVIGKVAATVLPTFTAGFDCSLMTICKVARVFARHARFLQ